MSDEDNIQKTLKQILQNLNDINRQIIQLRQNSATREQLEKISDRVQGLEQQAAADLTPEPPPGTMEKARERAEEKEPAAAETHPEKTPETPEQVPGEQAPQQKPEAEPEPPKPPEPPPAEKPRVQEKTEAETKTEPEPPAHPEPIIPPPPVVPPPSPVPPSSGCGGGPAEPPPLPKERPAPPPLKPAPMPARPAPKPPRGEWDWGRVEAWLASKGTTVGVFIIVLALGYGLSLGFAKLDLVGKVMVVYAACAVMWGVGLFSERKEKYSTWGKVLIAGGWAGLYLTTFLIHLLPAARVIEDASLDVFLLMAIAAGMIIHAFRYRSQALTTICYFIAFITIALTIHLARETYVSLFATAVLAVSMLFILRSLKWYWLALFSVAACYGTHAVWLSPLAAAFHSPGGHAGEFWPGLLMLVLYWVTFNLAVFITRPKDPRERGLSLWMFAVNYVLFVLVFRYHVGSLHPEWRWYFMAAMAAAYIFQTWIAHGMERKNLYTLSLVIAVLSTTMMFYFKLFGGGWLSVAWLIQAEALYAAGLLAHEKRFRWTAGANFVLAVGWLLARDLFMQDELTLWGLYFYKRTVIFATAAIIFYVNHALRYLLEKRIEEPPAYPHVFSYAASVLWFILMAKTWFPDYLLQAAVVSAVLALALMESGIRLPDGHFRIQGLFFTFLAVIAALIPLADPSAMYYNRSLYYRIGCEAAVIVFAYVSFARFQRLVLTSKESRHLEVSAAVFSVVAAVIAVLLMYREFEPRFPFMLSLAWMILGVALIEVGVALKNPFFRVQGYLVTGLALFWAVYTLVWHSGFYDYPGMHLAASAIVLAGFFHLFLRILNDARAQTSKLSKIETGEALAGSGPVLAVAFSAAGTLILVLLLRRELSGVSVFFISTAWLAAAIALLEAGIGLKNSGLRFQALIVAGAAFLYALWHNLVPGRLLFGPINERTLSLVICVFAIYYICFRLLRGERGSAPWVDLPQAGTLLSWSASALLVLLIQREFWIRWPAWVGGAWALVMIAFFLIGARRKSLNFLAQAAALSALVFFWTLFVTVPAPGPIASVTPQRVFAVSPLIALFYAFFAVLMLRGAGLVEEKRKNYVEWARDACSFAASILLVALITVEVNDYSRELVTVIWAGLSVVLFEIGAGINNRAFRSQGALLAAATFARALIINMFHAHGTVMGMSVRTASVLAAAAGLYYLYLRLISSKNDSPVGVVENNVGSVLSWFGLILIAVLIYMEVRPREYIAPAWTGLVLAAMATGVLLKDRGQLYQSMTVMAAAVIAVPALTFPEHGSRDGRIASGLAIAGMFAARVLWQAAGSFRRELFSVNNVESKFLAQTARHHFSVPAAVLLTILVPLEFHGALAKYLTLALSCEGLLLMILGFALADRILRFGGLGILAVCVVKIFYDLWLLDIGREYKVLAMAGLGVILVLIGWIYARFAGRIKKIMKE